MIGIVNYGLGNIKAVEKALYRLSIPYTVLNAPEDSFKACSHLILPGVGHFRTGMENLNSLGLTNVLTKELLEKKKPILGICLGMQLLAKESEEGNYKGLGFIDGSVKKMDPPDPGARIPHVGWNKFSVTRHCALLKNIAPDDRFYFVHSYGLPIAGSNYEAAVLQYYGSSICAIIEQNNFVGVQFHPEKSHDQGLKIFRNFYDCYA